MSLKLHPSYISDIQSIGANLSNLWLKSDVPMFYDSGSTLQIDNPCSMEVINLSDIRFQDRPTITVMDEDGNELYVTQPILVDETYAVATTNNNQTADWNSIVNRPSVFPPDVHVHAWADITSGKPTTLAGYGISSADTLFDSKYSASGHTHTFASLTSKPTTIAGYGITDAFTQTLADARYPQLTVQYTNPTWLAGIDATTIKTGTIDVARLPVMPSQVPVVSSGDLTALTAGQQTSIISGTVVTTTDGNRYVYSGSGDKTLVASYIQLADITPDWSVIANRPTNVSVWANDAGYLTSSIFSSQNTWTNKQTWTGIARFQGLVQFPVGSTINADGEGLMRLTGPNIYTDIFSAKLTGENYTRWAVFADGSMTFSNGGGITTSTLSPVLNTAGFNYALKIDSDVIVTGGLKVGGNSVIGANDSRLTDARTPLAHTHAWSDITGEPTTLAGYGITDAALATHTHTFASLTSKPTTLSGYGITDAVGSGDSRLTDTRTPTNNSFYVQGGNATRSTVLTDFNTVTYSTFASGQSATGTPAAGWHHLINVKYTGSTSNDWNFQIAAGFGTSATGAPPENYYMRIQEGTGWKAWRKLWHDGNFNPGNYQPLENQRLSTGNSPTFSTLIVTNGITANSLNATGITANGASIGNITATGDLYISSTVTTSGYSALLVGARSNWGSASTAQMAIAIPSTYSPWAFEIDKAGSSIFGIDANGNIAKCGNLTMTGSLTIAGSTITYTNVNQWNNAFITSHSHSNKGNLDLIDQSLASTANPTFAGIYSTGLMKGVSRSGDGGTYVFANATGSRSAISNGTKSVAINRYEYAGFVGFLGADDTNHEFYGITQDHNYSGGGAELSLIAGSPSGHISFHAGKPVVIPAGNGSASGCYMSPRVGNWSTTGLTVDGTLTVGGVLSAGNGSVINGDLTIGSCNYVRYIRVNSNWSDNGGETFIVAGNGRFTDYLAVNGRMYANDCQLNGVAFGSGNITQWNSCYDYAVSKGRIGMDSYTGEDTLTWASRNARGCHFGRIHNTSGSPNYFNFLQIRETSGTVFGVIGHAADGNWYVGRAVSGQEIATYHIVWTTKDISIATRDSWNNTAARVGNLGNYSNAYGIDRLYRRDATTSSNKYYIYNAWTTGQWYGNAWRISSANEHSDGQSGIYNTVVNFADQAKNAGTIQCFSGTNYQANIDTNRCPDYSGLWAGCVDGPTGTTPFGSSWTWLQEMGHSDANWRFQLASPYFSDNMAYRRKNNGTWMSWRYLVSTNAGGTLDNINLTIPGDKTLTVDGTLLSNKTISYTVSGSDLTGAGPYNIGPLDRNVVACPIATTIVLQTHSYAYFKIVHAIGGTVGVQAASGATIKRGSGGSATQFNIGAGGTAIVGYTPNFGFYFGFLY